MPEYKELDAILTAVPAKYADVIRALPTADVKPVLRGKWMPGSSDASYCSACWEPQETKFYMPNYCPNCGADMREVNQL